MQGLRNDPAGRMGGGCQLSLGLGCGNKERVHPRAKTVCQTRFHRKAWWRARDPGVAQVLFWVQKGLGRTQMPRAVLFVEPE